MMRYNLLEESTTQSSTFCSISEPTNTTTQYYKDTKVTISEIPGFDESRYNTSKITDFSHK